MAQKMDKTGRPTGFDRDAAVDAAMGLFWKKGFLAVSAKELAGAMSIQRSSFYNSFVSREALFREVLERYGSQSPDAILDRIQDGDAVIPVFVTMFRNLCRVRAADKEGRGCLVCNGVAELVGVEDEVGPLFEQALQHRLQVVERLLVQAAEQDEIPPLDNPPTAAKSFIAFLLGLNIMSKVVRDEAQLWATCRNYLRGIGVNQSMLDQSS